MDGRAPRRHRLRLLLLLFAGPACLALAQQLAIAHVALTDPGGGERLHQPFHVTLRRHLRTAGEQHVADGRPGVRRHVATSLPAADRPYIDLEGGGCYLWAGEPSQEGSG